MEWFKFYNSKWLSDLAIIGLNPIDRLCFITLLCVTAARDERNGTVTQYHEHHILTLTHLTIEDYKRGLGFTKRLHEAGLIEIKSQNTIYIKNFEKRQNSLLSPAERSKKYRDKSKVTNVTKKSDERTARVDKSRVDKSRESKPQKSLSFLREIPGEDCTELSLKYKISEKGVREKSQDLLLYCKQKGKVYKDYKSFLENAIRKDKTILQNKFPYVAPNVQDTLIQEKLTPEQMEKNAKMRERIRAGLSKKMV